MRQWDFDFAGDWPAGLVFAAGVAAVLLAYASYRRKRSRVSPRVFGLLCCLRGLAILAVAFFLMKPVIRISGTRTVRRSVAVLLDASQSMGIRDAIQGKSRLEAGLRLLREPPYRLLDRLADTHEVHLFAFGPGLSETDPQAEVHADRRSTAIGEALREAASRLGASRLSGVVLLTDVLSNAGKDPRVVARYLGVPVFPVCLGGKLVEAGTFRDVAVTEVPRNPEVVVNSTARLEFGISGIGLGDLSEADRTVALALREGDKTLATAGVALPAQRGTIRASLEYVPREVGVHRLTVSLPELPGEAVTANNAREFTVRAIDPRVRVLLVEGAVRSEYRFLRRVLESDPATVLTSVVKLRRDVFLVQGHDAGVDLSRGLPARKEDYAKKFDVVLLGDIAREEFTDRQLEDLKEFVSGGGGLLVMGGYHAFGAGGYAGSPLGDVLPVTLGGRGDGHVAAQFSPQLTAAGKEHPVFQGCAEFFLEESGSARAVLAGANRVGPPKPGATVLAVHPRETVKGVPLPVVAVQRYGAGRVLAFTGDTTWRWKFQIEGRGLDSPYYRFWRQSVRWLAGRTEQFPGAGTLLMAWTDKVEYQPGQAVLLRAKLRDRQGQPLDHAQVEARVEYPAPVREEGEKTAQAESAALPLDHVPLSLGEYQAAFTPSLQGVYHAEVTASIGKEELGRAQVEFVVGEAVGELDRVDVDDLSLRAIASETGGEFYTFATAERIPQALEARRRRVVFHEEKTLWNTPVFFAVFLGCITLEWVIRKRHLLN